MAKAGLVAWVLYTGIFNPVVIVVIALMSVLVIGPMIAAAPSEIW
jgi:hypothetical protein